MTIPSTTADLTVARYLCLGIPVLFTVAGLVVDRRTSHHRRGAAAALLAFVAAFVGIAALHELAQLAGWYAFASVDGSFRGLPVDVWLGWAALWGPVPVLLRRVLPLPVALGLLLWLDVVTMPRLTALVTLDPYWLVGDAIGLLLVALPAQLLGRWTASRRHLPARVLLQLTVFTGLALWLVPTTAFTLGGDSWRRLADLPLPWLLVLAQLGLLVAVPGLSAVQELATRGRGTPYPWDPPGRLVTTGPYAYLANPMQVSMVGLLLLLAVATRSLTLAGAAGAAVAFSAAVANPHEQTALRQRFGPQWTAYRQQVRAWWPRLRPYQPDQAVPATLWLDEGCGACRAVAGFLLRRRPRGLVLAAAGPRLWRARYASGTGRAEGVAAVARGLEHVTLRWAYLGWLLRLPGVGWLAQVVTDALIAPPHPARTATVPGGGPCPATQEPITPPPSPPVPASPRPGPTAGPAVADPTPGNACWTGRSSRSGSTASPESRPGPSPPPPG